MTKFELDMDAMIKRTCLKADTIMRKIALDLFLAVIMKTPVAVDNGGMARGNWQFSTDAPATAPVTRVDPAGTTVVADVTNKIPGWDTKKSIFLSNSLPYIRTLEYGFFPTSPRKGEGKTIGGFSRQAPAGMVRISVAEISGQLNRLIGA